MHSASAFRSTPPRSDGYVSSISAARVIVVLPHRHDLGPRWPTRGTGVLTAVVARFRSPSFTLDAPDGGGGWRVRGFGDLEAVIMDRLWSWDRPSTVRDVVDDLREEREIAYT